MSLHTDFHLEKEICQHLSDILARSEIKRLRDPIHPGEGLDKSGIMPWRACRPRGRRSHAIARSGRRRPRSRSRRLLCEHLHSAGLPGARPYFAGGTKARSRGEA